MRFHRTKSKCNRCPLDEEVVQGKGLMQGIAFFGEAPGSKEVSLQEPFVGPAGTYFSWALKHAEIERSQVWVSNVVSCKIPGNDWDGFEGEEARNWCSFGFEEELRKLREQGVRVIVAFGGNVAHFFEIEGKISKVRGSVYERRGFYVIPTYHPSYFQRLSRKVGDNTVLDLKVAWISDLLKAKRISREGWVAPKEQFVLSPTPKEFEEWLDSCEGELLSVDIETTGFSVEHSGLVVVGFAKNSEEAIAIPFLDKGGKPYATNGTYEQFVELLNRAFQTHPLMFQNALFDVLYLRRKGFEISLRNVAHDTLILHHTIVPEQPHNLGYIVSMYGDTPYWKDALLERGGSILEMENDLLRRYNLRDCVVLHQILAPMLEDLRERDVEKIYYEEALPLLEPIGEMMETGLVLDRKKQKAVKVSYEESIERIEGSLRDGKILGWKIPGALNFSSGDDLAWLLYRRTAKKFKKLDELKEYEEESASGKVRSKKTKAYEKLLALKSIYEETPEFALPSGFRFQLTDSKKPSTNEQAVLSLTVAMAKRVKQIDNFKTTKEVHIQEKERLLRQINWLENFSELKHLKKIQSTYLDFPVELDGKVHTHLLIHGTKTGRLSSREPNFQNIPKERHEIRGMLRAEDGCTLVAADYANLEVLVLAYVSEDQPLIDLLEGGENMHDVNTKTLFGIDEDDPQWKAARAAAKVFMFGGISYGGGDREIFQKVQLKAPTLGLQLKDFVRAKNRWMAAHPAYKAWADRVKEEALRTRISTNFAGRKRELMGQDRDIEKQALNSPIQGGAASIINRATRRIFDKKRRGDSPLKWKLVLQIHDELILQVPDEASEIEGAKKLLSEEMSAPIEINGKFRVFPVDFEVGRYLSFED